MPSLHPGRLAVLALAFLLTITRGSALAAPDTTIESGPAAQTNQVTAMFTFTGTGTTFECDLDGGGFVACTSPLTTPALPDGQHTFSVRAIDASNVADPTPAPYTWTIDLTPPTVVIAPAPDPTSDTTPTFSFTVAGNPVSTRCRIDGTTVDDVDCASSFTALAPLGGGSHVLFVTVTDAAGNSATVSHPFAVDITPPETTALTGPPPRTKDTVASFTFSSELGATFACRLDLGAFDACSGASLAVGSQQQGSHTTGALSEGFHTFEVLAIDTAGNVDPTPASYTWFVDLTPPVAGFATTPANPSNQPTPLFVFTSEPGATFQCKIDAASFASCPATYLVSPDLTTGTHTIYVLAVDSVGNVQIVPTTYTWTVDLEPPQTTITQLGSIPSDAVVTFVLASDEATTFECNLDGTGFVACDPSYTTPPLSEGQHTLIARAVDAAGNKDPSPAQQTWIVDTIPPDTFLLTSPPTISHQATATFEFTATEQPVTFECSLDGAVFAACTSPFTTPALADGHHTFAVRARDTANRVDETPATSAWTIALNVSLCDGGPFVCRAPGATKLTIRNSAKDAADKLEFRWALGDATTSAELGDPTVDTEYAVCVWDTAAGTPVLVMTMQAPPAGNCAGKPCWRSLHDGTAFRYKDFGLLPDGVQQLTVRSGPLGKASIFLKGRGLPLPDPPMPFTQQPTITVQVVNGAGTCWGAAYVVAPRVNTEQKLLVEEKP